mmetsp:Transcript_19804/g.37265  ORF Transcript_19804/g.37265 Transcript_19804/m.37265 type:complete len:924 (-) Transcript_19804:953-3724(-)
MNTQFLLPLPGAATAPVGTTLAAMTANTPHLTNEQHRHRQPHQLSHRHQQHHHKLVQQTQPNLNHHHHHHQHPNGLPAVVVIDDEMSDETVAPQVAPPSPPQSSHGVAAPQQTKPLETQQPHTNQSPRKRSHVASSSSDCGAINLLSGGPLHNAISANDAPFSHHHKSAAGGAPNAAAAVSNKDDDLLAFERDMNRSHGSLGGCSNDGLPDAPLSGDGLLMFTGPEVFDFDDCLDDKNKAVFEGVGGSAGGGAVQGKQVQDLAREKGVDVLSAMFEEDNAATAANANAQQQQQRQHNSQQLQHGQQSPHSQQHGSEASFDVYDLASAPALPVPAVPAMVPVRPSPPPHSSAPHLAYVAPQVALPPPQPMTSMPLAPPPLVQAPPQHQGHQQHQGHHQHQNQRQHQPHQQHQRHHHRESVLSTYSASSVHSAASYDASAAAAQAHAPQAASSFDAANAQYSQTQAAQARHRDSIRSVLSATQSFSAGVGDRGGHGGNNDLQHLDNMSPEYRAKAKIQLEIEAQAERVRRSFLEAENSSSSGKGRRGSKSKNSSAAAAAAAAAAADMAAANSSMKRRRTSEGFEASVSSLENSPSAPRRSSFVSLPAGGGHGGGSGRSKRPSLVKKRTDGRPIFQSGLRNYFRSCSSESERSSPPSVVASASPTANFHKSTTDLHSAWTTAMGGTTSRLHDSARSCDLPPRHHPRTHPRPPKRGSIAENLSASGSVSNLLSNMHLNSETVTLEGRDGASIEVTKNDVVIGANNDAGTDTTNGEASVTDALVGNRRFAVLIDLHARSYADADAEGRIEVARSVVHTVTSSVPPGRFLKQLDDDAEADTEGSAEKKGLWGEMSYQEAVEYAQRSLGDKTTSEVAKACPHSPMSSDGSKKSVDSKSTVVSVVEPIVEEEKKSRRANMRRMSSGRALAA